MGKTYGTKPLLPDEDVFAILGSDVESHSVADAGGQETRPEPSDLPGESLERLLGGSLGEAGLARHWKEWAAQRATSEFPDLGSGLAARFRGFCVWLNGSAAEGAAKLATALGQELHTRGLPREVLDRSVIRRSFSQSLSMLHDDPAAESRQMIFLAELLSRHGVAVIALAGPTHPRVRMAVREAMSDRVVEVYAQSRSDTEAHIEIYHLHEDPGGLADTAVNVYEPPVDIDVVCDIDHETLEESVHRVIDYLQTHDLLPTGQEEFVLG